MQSQAAPTMHYNVRHRFCRSKTSHFSRRNILESLKYQYSLCTIVGEGGLLAKNSLNIYKNCYFSKIFAWDQIKMFLTKVAPNVGRLHYDSDLKPSFIKKNQFCPTQIFFPIISSNNRLLFWPLKNAKFLEGRTIIVICSVLKNYYG